MMKTATPHSSTLVRAYALKVFKAIRAVLMKPVVRSWKPTRGQRGVALILVTVIMAVIMAITAQFVYTSEINHASAKNVTNELKAHYLARSVISLTQLLLKVQEKVIDRNRALLGDIQLTSFMDVMLPAFFGGGSDLLGLALGADPKDIRGLEFKASYGKASWDTPSSEDGKININCAYVRSDQDPQVQQLAGRLMALFVDQRYNFLFEEQDETGNYNDRETVVRALLDYVDADEAKFGMATAAEDYGYDTLRDPYKAKNNMMDSVLELRLVRGVTDDFWANFADSLTIYGHCTPNLCAIPDANWIMVASILWQSAVNQGDPVFRDLLRLKALSEVVLQQVKFGGCTDINQFIQAAQNPLPLAQLLGTAAGTTAGTTGQDTYLGMLSGIELDPQKVSATVHVGARRFYKLVARGEVGGVVKQITAVWDQQLRSPSTGVMGGFVYWRED